MNNRTREVYINPALSLNESTIEGIENNEVVFVDKQQSIELNSIQIQPVEDAVASSTPVIQLEPNNRGDGGLFQITNNHTALAVLCLCAFMQNVLIGGANNAILTTIERAFYMTSIESALFLTFYDVANIVASPVIGYFGDRKYKPTIIGVSMLGLCLGAFIMTLPQFVGGVNDTSSTIVIVYSNETGTAITRDQMVCNWTNDSTTMGMTTTTTTAATNQFKPRQQVTHLLRNNLKYLFYLANIVNGVSSVSLYTITISYIESIFHKEQVNLRQGIYYAIGAIGVGIGMLVTGNFLNINGVSSRRNNRPMMPHLPAKSKPSMQRLNVGLQQFNGSAALAINSSNVNWIGVSCLHISFSFSFFHDFLDLSE